MDSYDSYGSPPGRSEPRYGRDDDFGRDTYRRRSPGRSFGKTDSWVPDLTFCKAMGDRRARAAPARDRSRSPMNIDRYQPGRPRDDYYDASRDRPDRRRAPSPQSANVDRYIPDQSPPRYIPGQNSARPVLTTNVLPNPLTLEYQVGFNYFAEWWRLDQQIKEDKERAKNGGRRLSSNRTDREAQRAQIQAAYDSYKAELQIKMARTFVQHHKDEEWFKERYVDEIRGPIRQRMMDFRRSAYDAWVRDMDSGVFDQFTLEGIYKTESDGAGGVIEKEEGEATAVGETLGVQDLVPIKGGDLRDETVFQPALLIKTLAPNVSREKIEEFCKEHLGEGDGGFKWLSLSDPNPAKKCHRIGWIMLNPGAEETTEIKWDDGRGGDGEEGAVESGNKTSYADRALELINGKTIVDPARGDFTCHVGVHAPPSIARKKALWDLFSAPERVERDLQLARRIVDKFDGEMGVEDSFLKIEYRVLELREQGLLQAPASTKTKKPRAFEEQDDVIPLDDGEASEDGAIDEEDDVDDDDLLFKKKELDLIVEYLRRVYNFCFFCVFESDSVHELVRKCPGGHLRRPRSGLSSQAKEVARASASGEPFPVKKKETTDEGEVGSPANEKKTHRHGSKGEQQLQRAFNWVKTFEDKILQILEPENADLKKLGGKPVEEAVDDELKKFVKQEDESKFRCKVPECVKLFKAEHFWKKHVEKRHAEWLEKMKLDATLVNAYVLDPAHIAPSRSDATSNGHFPNGNNMPTGTPRGFNLNNMQMNMNNFHPGLMQQVVSTGSFGNNMMGDLMGGHQPGVMRRGGQRYNNNNRSAGPYERRGRGAGGMNNGNGAGGMGRNGAPNGGNGTMGGAVVGGRWDGAGGQAVGPREAVQGRSLKSYEDLDAVEGGAGGELNY